MSIEINVASEGISEKCENEVTNLHHETWHKFTKYFIMGLASFGSFCSGCFLTWSSAAVPILQQSESLQITAYQGSWVASLVLAGALIGALISFRFAEYCGPKRALQVASVVLIVAWMLIGFSGSLYGIEFGRFLGGISVGLISELSPMYTEDISHSDLQDLVIPLCRLQLTIGMLFQYVIGTTEDYVCISISSCCLVLLFLITFSFLPESPVHTQRNTNTDRESLEILEWLRHPEPEMRLSRIRESLQNVKNERCLNRNDLKILLKDKAISRACAVGTILLFFQQLSGVTAILFYGVKVFTKSSAVYSAHVSVVILGCVFVFSTSLSTLFSDKFGRRFLLLISSIVMCISLCSLGIFIHLQASYDLSGYTQLPLICLSAALSAHAIGFGPIPFLMISELFPSEMKNVIKKCSIGFHWVLAFAVTKTFRGVMDIIGPGWLFWNFGSCCFFSALFVFFCVPETKSRELDEIQNRLRGITRRSRTVIQIDIMEDGMSVRSEEKC